MHVGFSFLFTVYITLKEFFFFASCFICGFFFICRLLIIYFNNCYFIVDRLCYYVSIPLDISRDVMHRKNCAFFQQSARKKRFYYRKSTVIDRKFREKVITVMAPSIKKGDSKVLLAAMMSNSKILKSKTQLQAFQITIIKYVSHALSLVEMK